MGTRRHAGGKRRASDADDAAAGGAAAGSAPVDDVSGQRKSRRLAAAATGTATAPPQPPLGGSSPAPTRAADGDFSPGGPTGAAAAAAAAAAASTTVAPAAASAVEPPPPADAPVANDADPAFLLSLPDDLLRVVASRLTLLDRGCLAATCRPLYDLLYEGVALGAANALLGPADDDAPAVRRWVGPCVPHVVPMPTGKHHPDTVDVVGVRFPRGEAAAQGRAALRAVTMAAETAAAKHSLPTIVAHILECHPDGVYAGCAVANRALMSKSAARTLWGIPASYEWVESCSGVERRNDYGWYIAHPLRQVLREAFHSRTPTGGSGGGGGGGGGSRPIGLVRLVADMETRRAVAARREGVRAKAATAAAAVVDRLVAERVAGGGGGSSCSSDGGGRKVSRGSAAAAAAGTAAAGATSAAGRPAYARWVQDGLYPARCAVSSYVSGSPRGRQAAATALLDDVAAVYDGLGADLHAFYDGCTRREWSFAAMQLGLAAQAPKDKTAGLDSVAAVVATLSKPRSRKSWTGKCKCCHKGQA